MKLAFSLVELSIVLVILGLLVGGVLSGQSLIRAAEIRGVSTDISKYQAASQAFRDKYFAIPGDMKNATSFWGNATTGTTGGDCTAPESDAGTAPQTCNGNGDGLIGQSGNTNLNNSEVFRYWQHLANAGLIEGRYAGVASDTPAGGTTWRVAVPGTNIPAGRLPRSGFTVASTAISSNGSGGVNSWAGGDTGVIKQWAYVGAATTGDLNWGAVLKPEELWNIDTKLDDGLPGTGIIRPHGPATGCSTSNDPTTAVYPLTTTTISCTAFVDMKI